MELWVTVAPSNSQKWNYEWQWRHLTVKNGTMSELRNLWTVIFTELLTCWIGHLNWEGRLASALPAEPAVFHCFFKNVNFLHWNCHFFLDSVTLWGSVMVSFPFSNSILLSVATFSRMFISSTKLFTFFLEFYPFLEFDIVLVCYFLNNVTFCTFWTVQNRNDSIPPFLFTHNFSLCMNLLDLTCFLSSPRQKLHRTSLQLQ